MMSTTPTLLQSVHVRILHWRSCSARKIGPAAGSVVTSLHELIHFQIQDCEDSFEVYIMLLQYSYNLVKGVMILVKNKHCINCQLGKEEYYLMMKIL